MNRHRSWAGAVLWALGLVAAVGLALAMPGGPVAAEGMGQASHGGATFSYDTAVATDVRGETVAGNVGQGAAFSAVRPAHICFTFSGYPATGVWTPQLRVLPRAAYEAALAPSGAAAAFPALAAYLGDATGRPLPNLPAVDSARVISADVAPMAGHGLTGVRFVAAYAQGIAPVRVADLVYVYTGLTADGRYYVEGTFPVALATPLDPPPAPVTPENARAYNDAVAARLAQTGATGFTPSLDLLDKMLSSIQISTAAIPGMPTTGAGGAPALGAPLALLALAFLLLGAGLTLSRRARTFRTR